MAKPEGIAAATCREGSPSNPDKKFCEGPCNMKSLRVTEEEVRKIRRGIDVFADRKTNRPLAHFYPPNKPAALYKRGQTITIKYTRNNHAPGGFERYTLVPLKFNWLSKAVHAKLAVHYACWGENPRVAAPDELERKQFGFSLVGSDGQNHRFPKAYYTTRLTIPDVVPDGKYMVGFAWYGGCGGPLKGNTPQEAGPRSTFVDFWSCSFIEIKGGNPLGKEYEPVFVGSRFANPRGSACKAASNALGQCTNDPCSGKTCEYMKPREFLGDGPRTLTPADFGYTGEEPSSPSPKPKTDASPELEIDLEEELSKKNPNRQVLRRAVFSCACIRDGDKCRERRAERSYNCKSGKTTQFGACKQSCCILCKYKPKRSICNTVNVKKTCS